jgi:hypothetical protein
VKSKLCVLTGKNKHIIPGPGSQEKCGKQEQFRPVFANPKNPEKKVANPREKR